MTKIEKLIVNLPFDGFYESAYSDIIDREDESWGEYEAEEYEPSWPEPLQLDASDLAELLYHHTDYKGAHNQIARDYVDAFDCVAGEALGISRKGKPSLCLEFESMSSPREYNFETDKIFAYIPAVIVRRLFKISRDNMHAMLAATIQERFTSCSGFISFYSNDIAAWLEKPVESWDHNELGTLLIAVLKLSDFNEVEVLERTSESSSAWDSAVDWQAFEAARLELRREKFNAWMASDASAANAWLASGHEGVAMLKAD